MTRLAIPTIAAVFAAAVLQQLAAAGHTFVDPSARISGRRAVALGEHVYVAPFAQLLAGERGQRITIGDESNVQDNVLLNARARAHGEIEIGEQVILAHGAAVTGPASLGEHGACPEEAGAEPHACPSFVGFNAVVDGAVVEKDAMVLAMARVAKGVVVPSGWKVLPGKFVRTQGEVADDAVPVTAADRAFMHAVIEVNVELARGYGELSASARSHVYGINVDPDTPFNPGEELPTLAGRPTRIPGFRNRLIGDLRAGDGPRALDARLGRNVSLRADEGDPFVLGRLRHVGDRHTMHALEFSGIQLGDGASLGFHTVVHGGGPIAPNQPTAAGRNLRLGDYSAFFRGFAGDNVSIGDKSLVQGTALPANARVPSCTVVVDAVVYPLEWCREPFPGPQAPHEYRNPFGSDGDDDRDDD